ncbi:phosphopantetheine-binding protein [Aquimarina sp. MMG016]|uniref:phosphopantetheine-binding protein n=1 Tax=Aquimarina sp. MMG016 TaxID=2822690 RepID=UPI001B39E116|nr:phosphopantetheine-binding protein [Aquimarina sp. MMG016]MBQ4820080.1 hypothetical protein [Aquimarina sp. MMG016]
MEITEKNLKEILKKSYHGDLDEIEMTSELSQIVDSLDMLDFYMHLEETYEIQIPDEDVDKLKTFQDVKQYIEEKLN